MEAVPKKQLSQSSHLSDRHLNEEDRQMRTSSLCLTAANVTKLYIGITLISVSKSIANVGIYTAIIGFVYVCLMNLYSVWLIVKARNRFRNHRIADICDLAAILYGEVSRKWVILAMVLTNLAFLSSYSLYFGD